MSESIVECPLSSFDRWPKEGAGLLVDNEAYIRTLAEMCQTDPTVLYFPDHDHALVLGESWDWEGGWDFFGLMGTGVALPARVARPFIRWMQDHPRFDFLLNGIYQEHSFSALKNLCCRLPANVLRTDGLLSEWEQSLRSDGRRRIQKDRDRLGGVADIKTYSWMGQTLRFDRMLEQQTRRLAANVWSKYSSYTQAMYRRYWPAAVRAVCSAYGDLARFTCVVGDDCCLAMTISVRTAPDREVFLITLTSDEGEEGHFGLTALTYAIFGAFNDPRTSTYELMAFGDYKKRYNPPQEPELWMLAWTNSERPDRRIEKYPTIYPPFVFHGDLYEIHLARQLPDAYEL